jgi:hypothetical protein
MGETAPIFNPAEEEGRSVREQRRACIKNAIDWVWPVSAGQDWVRGVAMEQWFVMIVTYAHWITDNWRD